RVQRREQPPPPAGALPAEGRSVPAGQLAEGGVLPAAATGVPRAGPPRLSGEQVAVGLLLGRECGRRSAQCPAPVHRAAEPPRLTSQDADPPGGSAFSAPLRGRVRFTPA